MTQPTWQPAPPTPPTPPPPTKPRSRRWLWIGGSVVAFVVGIGVGGAGQKPEPSKAAAERTVTVTAPAPPADTVTAPAPAPVTVIEEPPPPPGPAATLGNGVYEVGVDVAPGQYKTDGPSGSMGMCYWARSNNDSGEFEALITNGIVEGPGSLTINAGEFVEISGEYTWNLVG